MGTAFMRLCMRSGARVRSLVRWWSTCTARCRVIITSRSIRRLLFRRGLHFLSGPGSGLNSTPRKCRSSRCRLGLDKILTNMSASRRAFLGGLTAASYSRVMGANDRVQVGFIGYGLIGAQHVFDFKNQRDVDMAAMCDVYQPRLEQGVAACGGSARAYKDFRKLIDDK